MTADTSEKGLLVENVHRSDRKTGPQGAAETIRLLGSLTSKAT